MHPKKKGTAGVPIYISTWQNFLKKTSCLVGLLDDITLAEVKDRYSLHLVPQSCEDVCQLLLGTVYSFIATQDF